MCSFCFSLSCISQQCTLRALALHCAPAMIYVNTILCVVNAVLSVLALLDFFGTLLFFYNISFDFATFESCFSYIFWNLLEFYSILSNRPTNTCQNHLVSWTFSGISSKVQLFFFAMCQKQNFRHDSTRFVSHRLDFSGEPTESPNFPACAGIKKNDDCHNHRLCVLCCLGLSAPARRKLTSSLAPKRNRKVCG